MSPDLSSAVLLADDLLGGIVAAYPEFAGERDMHLDLETGPAVDDQPSGRGAPEFGGVPGEIIRHERGIERQLAEAGYYVLPRIGERNVLKTEDDGHVRCLIGGFVDDDDLSGITVVCATPVVYRLVGANRQRPLADLIRLVRFLVRLGGNFFGRSCECDAFLGHGVGVLRELVRRARLDQGEAADDAGLATACWTVS